jgi:hypothetical protein
MLSHSKAYNIIFLKGPTLKLLVSNLENYEHEYVALNSHFDIKFHFSYFHEFSLFMQNRLGWSLPNRSLSRNLSNDISFVSIIHLLTII